MALCPICKRITNGDHYEAATCEGCKKFFMRASKYHGKRLRCLQHEEACKWGVLVEDVQGKCKLCRYDACVNAGMNRKNIKLGRKRIHFARPIPCLPPSFNRAERLKARKTAKEMIALKPSSLSRSRPAARQRVVLTSLTSSGSVLGNRFNSPIPTAASLGQSPSLSNRSGTIDNYVLNHQDSNDYSPSSLHTTSSQAQSKTDIPEHICGSVRPSDVLSVALNTQRRHTKREEQPRKKSPESPIARLVETHQVPVGRPQMAASHKKRLLGEWKCLPKESKKHLLEMRKREMYVESQLTSNRNTFDLNDQYNYPDAFSETSDKDDTYRLGYYEEVVEQEEEDEIDN